MTVTPTARQALHDQLLELLQRVSSSPDSWMELLTSVYGAERVPPGRAEEIRQSWQAGQPGFELRWVGEETLPEAWGGYPTGSDVVLLNGDRLDGESLAFQLGIAVEEAGHWLDQQWAVANGTPEADTPGDEGWAFATQTRQIIGEGLIEPRLHTSDRAITITNAADTAVEVELADADVVNPEKTWETFNFDNTWQLTTTDIAALRESAISASKKKRVRSELLSPLPQMTSL